ncbi:hypothetical protein DDQ68_08090 [Hymenobacter nivis]|uniref:Uncharacterized protein n=1 Tax=Hymenobacter nivis TaxID=1850093 RepID=A0A2Z3GTQ0_9BACT|nr:hypothetical protein DDQ68_08090 [Hymenobacter nivis]
MAKVHLNWKTALGPRGNFSARAAVGRPPPVRSRGPILLNIADIAYRAGLALPRPNDAYYFF